MALQEVSKRVAAAHDTDEVLDLIVNEAARLVGAPTVIIRLLDGDVLVIRAATEGLSRFSEAVNRPSKVEEGANLAGHVMATKKPLFGEEVVPLHLPEILRAIEKEGGDPAAGGVVPPLANDQSIGTLAVAYTSHQSRRITEDEISLLTAFADQASLALEKARLLNEAETEKERAETEREHADSLYQISNQLAGAHDTDEVLDLIVNEAARLVDGYAAFIRLLDGGVLVPSAATESAAGYLAGVAEVSPALGVGQQDTISGRVLATQKPLVIEDAATSGSTVPQNVALAEKYGLHGLVSVPLIANDRSVGVLHVFDNRIRLFTEDEVSLLSAFADQASLALEKARLLNEAETERERSDSLYRVSNLLAGTHDTDEVMDLIVNEAARLVGATGVWMRLLEGEGLVPGPATEGAAALLAEFAKERPTIAVGKGSTMQGRAMATKNRSSITHGNPDW